MSEMLRDRLAEIYGVSAAEVLPVRGFWHGAELILRLLRAKPGAEIACRASPEFERLSYIYDVSLVDAPSASTAAAFRQFYEGAAPLTRDALEVIDETDIEFSAIASSAGRAENVLVIRGPGSAVSRSENICAALIGEAKLIGDLENLREPQAIPNAIQEASLTALEPRALGIAKARRARLLKDRAELAALLSASDWFSNASELECAAVLVVPRDRDAFLAAARKWKVEIRPIDEKKFAIPLGGAIDASRIVEAFDLGRKASARTGEVMRDTLETKISAFVDLDREDGIEIGTGVGFFDHMLTQIAHHGGFSVTLSCIGDLDIDAHHTIEDCAIVFGQALSKALGDRRGIARFGYLLPMDEAEAKVSVDLGGRPFLVFNGNFTAPLIGAYPTEMTEHVFRSLSQALGASIHVSVTGENDHHKTEACFKAFGRALRQAIRIESDRTPSTKGAL